MTLTPDTHPTTHPQATDVETVRKGKMQFQIHSGSQGN